jgi:hypothetical protein
MRYYLLFSGIFLSLLVVTVSCKKKNPSIEETFTITSIRVGNVQLELNSVNKDVPADSSVFIEFSAGLATATIPGSIFLKKQDNSIVSCYIIPYDNDHAVKMIPFQPLDRSAAYKIQVTSNLKGAGGEGFLGVEYLFTTMNEKMLISAITLNHVNFKTAVPLQDIDRKNMVIEILFSQPLDSSNYQSFFALLPGVSTNFILSDMNKKVTITNTVPLKDYTRYYFFISNDLVSKNGNPFDGFTNSFYTELDTTPKFPVIPDDDLLTLIQHNTFRYFYDFAHPACGLARERNTSGDIVTIGGSGFGVMALIVGMDRGFITRQEGLTRLGKILGFLETCDRFHGAWPHWLNGSTGKTIPFTFKDDGADLVETSYMVEGLYTMRQYLDPVVPEENQLIGRIDGLTDAVEYDWFTRGQNVLYWHWSPDYDWAMNMQIRGYNEALITYIVAASSTLHPVSAAVYHEGYARNGAIQNGNSYYGYVLPLGEPYGGPLFFTHYSFLGLDPRNLHDIYAGYMEQNVNQSLINRAYCADNPGNYVGYSDQCWGLTASDGPKGYNAHSPTNDQGVIAPTAAVSALPYVPEQSMAAIRHFYYMLGDRLWGQYGFYDAFDVTDGWWADSYLAIDQGPIICMIENYRSNLLWNLFMSHPKVGPGLTKLGFSF